MRIIKDTGAIDCHKEFKVSTRWHFIHRACVLATHRARIFVPLPMFLTARARFPFSNEAPRKVRARNLLLLFMVVRRDKNDASGKVTV